MKIEVIDDGKVIFTGSINDDALPADLPEPYKTRFSRRPYGIGIVRYVHYNANSMGNMMRLPNNGIRIIER